MSEESTTPDLVESVRGSVQAASDRDLDKALTFYASDAVWDMSPWGMGTFAGAEAIRGFWEDWLDAYEEYAMETEEIIDFGHGVTFAVVLQKGRLVGSAGECSTALRGDEPLGARTDDEDHELPRHRRGPCCR